MGTSNSYGGPGGGNPLVPSWLDAPPPPQGGTPLPQQGGSPAPTNPPPGELPVPNRFQAPRRNFNTFFRGGGESERPLRRGVAQYVGRATGGSRDATRRMGTARTAGAKLYGFLSTATERGAREALQAIHLERLAGRPIAEVFSGICDVLCPDGGPIEEGITRHAFIETIAEVTALGITDLDSLTQDEMTTVLEIFFTNSIEARVCNDVGNKGIVLPESIDDVEHAFAQLHELIRTGVADAIARTRNSGHSGIRADEFVDCVYEAAFAFLENLIEAGDQP